jgi:hypothetical protein
MRNDRPLERYLSVLPLAPAAAEADLRRGQFHDVVLLGGAAYRFPRDEQSRRALPGRVALLRALGGVSDANAQPAQSRLGGEARRAPAAATAPGALGNAGAGLAELIPRPLADPDLSQPVGRCHAVLRRLPGRPLGRDASGPAGIAAELSRVLNALAEMGSDPAVRAAVPGADPAYWERFADGVEDVLFPMMTDAGRRRASAELAAVKTVDPTGNALVHGDLGGANLLWTATAPGGFRLTGIIDWDEAHIGRQADDLASLAATFGWGLAGSVDRLRHGGESPAIADARLIEATFALQQALPAVLIGDAESLADGLIRYTV